MFVRLWAGPSCIARAISRRRSSWALRTSRDWPVGASYDVLDNRLLACGPIGELHARLDGRPEVDREPRDGVAEPPQRLALALEDLDLALHDPRPPRQDDQLGIERDDVVGRRRVGKRLELFDRLGALQLVPLGLHARLRDQHVDLGELAVERLDLGHRACGDVGEGAAGGLCPGC